MNTAASGSSRNSTRNTTPIAIKTMRIGQPLGGDGERARRGNEERCDGDVSHWPNLCLAQAWIRLMNSRMAKAIISITVAMAAAADI